MFWLVLAYFTAGLLEAHQIDPRKYIPATDMVKYVVCWPIILFLRILGWQ